MTAGSRLPLPYLSADDVFALPWRDAVDALETALRAGLDPAASPERGVVDVSAGQLLLMPAETPAGVGVKVASVGPGEPARGVPRIQGLYLLLDPATLTPTALLDGPALTTLRTPAVSALAVRHLADEDAARLVVFGSGPQAWGHVEAVAAVRPVRHVTVVGRDRARAEQLARRVGAAGLDAVVGDAGAVVEADVVVCATTAREPLFDHDLVGERTCVVAVGSHEPTARELDAVLLERAGVVVVEDQETALREAGDVVLAVAEGRLEAESLTDLSALVRRAAPPEGPTVFKSVGMGWQDLVVAQAVLARQMGER